MPQSGILYAVVSRGEIILAEYNGVQGNAGLICLQILEKINASNGDRSSYLIDSYVFHVLHQNGITFLCMTDQSFGRRIAFAFLQDVQFRFQAAHGSAASSAPAYAFDASFSPVLAERSSFHSNPLNDNLSRVAGEVDSLRDVMVQNIENILDRGQQLELLVQKTDNLSHNAFVFKRGATQLKRNIWWRNTRTTIGVVALLFLALYFFVAVLCGGPLLHSCRM